jgi:hypothetical protein
MTLDGSTTELIVPSVQSLWPTAWSRDGRLLTYLSSTPTGWRIWTATNRSEQPPSIYRDASFIIMSPEISPNGQWLAYSSNESGQSEVYVDSFPTPSTRIRLSEGGGAWPKWRADGREFYYLALNRKLMASSVIMDNPGQHFAPAIALFEGPGTVRSVIRRFALSVQCARRKLDAGRFDRDRQLAQSRSQVMLDLPESEMRAPKHRFQALSESATSNRPGFSATLPAALFTDLANLRFPETTSPNNRDSANRRCARRPGCRRTWRRRRCL